MAALRERLDTANFRAYARRIAKIQPTPLIDLLDMCDAIDTLLDEIERLDRVESDNEGLWTHLAESRSEIAALRERVQFLGTPPLGWDVFNEERIKAQALELEGLRERLARQDAVIEAARVAADILPQGLTRTEANRRILEIRKALAALDALPPAEEQK